MAIAAARKRRLSRTSNQNSGSLDELNCALGVAKKLGKELIVTLQLDDIHINIQRRNHITFQTLWAWGLAKLLERLKQDGIATLPNFSPDAACCWWLSQVEFSAEQGLLGQADEHLSNWFLIRGLPRPQASSTLTGHERATVLANCSQPL